MRNLVAKVATESELLVTKDEMLVALATISVAISSPELEVKIRPSQEKKSR